MVFQNKAGLWLLLAIPVLIIIYLIRSHHEEYPVSSTYIWRLSSRFRKKRLPMQKFRRFVLFLTQLLTIAAVAGIISRPAIANGDSINYIVILDASGSMKTVDSDGVSRFDKAVDEIEKLTDYINAGHTVTLITASDTAGIVLQNCEKGASLKQALKDLSCTDGALNLSAAVELCEKTAADSDNAAVIFYTDSDYETGEAIEVINVNSGEWNIHVADVSYFFIKTAVTRTGANGMQTTVYRVTGCEFTGHIYSENASSSVTVGLKVDGRIKDVKEVYCEDGAVTSVTFTEDGITDFDTAEIYLIAEDGLSIDNSYTLCREQEVQTSVLLVSDSPLYLEAALSVLDNCSVTVIGTNEEVASGYDLYIFDCTEPGTLPTDGSVLLINSTAAGLVTLRDEITDTDVVPAKADTTDMSDVLRGLADDMSFADIHINAYKPIVFGSGWTGILYCNDDCVFCVRRNDNGLMQMVLSFDIHASNLPMYSDFVYFVRNILSAAVPSILYENDVNLGESITFSVLPSAESFYLEDPDGNIISLAIADSTITYTPDQAGVYTVIEQNAEGGAYADFFVHLSESESVTADAGELYVTLVEMGTDEEGNAVIISSENAKQALTPIWYWFALAALILLVAEWEVYYYEQY